jgi:glycosyltransferase involved in cell wall biosynthesis
MESIEAAKRNMMGTRLEMTKLCAFLGKDPWALCPNAAYDACSAPSVTVIITLYNYAEYIEECLNSVCATVSDRLPGGFDVLVIDDCSTDNSISLVETYIQKTNIPICLVKKAFNTGLADARNTGLQIARAPFIFTLDADNWIYPNCLSVLYDSITNSGCVAVYGIINRFDSKTGKGLGLLSIYEWDVYELLSGPYIDAMAMLKKDILLQVGGYSTELMLIAWSGWEDYDLWLKLAQAGYECKLVPQVLSSYRVHPNSMIHTTNAYAGTIIEHFKQKFRTLIDQHEDMITMFGVPRTETFDLHMTPGKLREKLAKALNTIAEMETSKFWKVRKQWLRIKKILRLPIT